jgi:hypothetical protein
LAFQGLLPTLREKYDHMTSRVLANWSVE